MSVKFRRKSKNMNTLKMNVILFLVSTSKLEYEIFLQAQQKIRKTFYFSANTATNKY